MESSRQQRIAEFIFHQMLALFKFGNQEDQTEEMSTEEFPERCVFTRSESKLSESPKFKRVSPVPEAKFKSSKADFECEEFKQTEIDTNGNSEDCREIRINEHSLQEENFTIESNFQQQNRGKFIIEVFEAIAASHRGKYERIEINREINTRNQSIHQGRFHHYGTLPISVN